MLPSSKKKIRRRSRTTSQESTRLRYSRPNMKTTTITLRKSRNSTLRASKSKKKTLISNLFSIENKLYSEKHTKAVIESERLILNKKLTDVKGDNTNMDREISRNKMFNKKDEEKKARKAEHDKLADKIKEQNKIIEENDILLDKERRILEDKDLVKKQTTIVNQLNQERGKVHIDISIAESRIKDLENAQKMTLGSIQELLIEKKKFDKENTDIEGKIAGRGMTEAE